MNDHETAGAELVPAQSNCALDPCTIQGRRLTPEIIDAQARVIHPHNCLDLPVKAKLVLRALLSFYNVRKGGIVFPSRETLGAELGMPESTLRRWLAMLTEKQYITREEQRRRKTSRFAPGRQFSVVPICLTEKALVHAGLLKPVIHKPPSPKMSDANNGEHGTKVISKKQGRPSNTNGQRTVPTIPTELQPLAELGMWPQTICKLMREAKDNGKLLSDIIATVRKRLVELKLGGKQIATYLRKAIVSKTDFAAQAKRVQDEERKAEQGRADAVYIVAFREQYAGKRLCSPDGRELVVIHSSGEHAQHRVGTMTGMLPLTNKTDVAYILNKVEKGLLVEGAAFPSLATASEPIRSAAVMEHLALMRKAVGLRTC